MEITLRHRARPIVVRLQPADEGYAGTVDDAPAAVRVVGGTASTPVTGVTVDDLVLEIGGRSRRMVVARQRDRVLVACGAHVYEFETGDAAAAERHGAIGSGTVTAPMPGKIVAVLVEPGDTVAVGAPLVVLEAMKMESTIAAEVAGTVQAVRVAAGALVAGGDVLVEIAAAK